MPYFKDNNLLLIHIPKTGGTSLESYFYNKFKIKMNHDSLFGINPIISNISLQHLTYVDIMKNKDVLDIDDNPKIISIVRNPYDRIVSDLFYFGFIKPNTNMNNVYNIIKKYLENSSLDNHNIPQYKFLMDENNELIDCIILKTESLNHDMHKCGFTDFAICHNKNIKVNKNNYMKYLNKQSIELINSFYDKDFEIFGYKKM